MGDGRPAEAPVETAPARRDRGLRPARFCEAENRLAAKLRAVGQGRPDYLATVSHELRTPLTSIAGYVEMLREEQTGPLTPAQAAMLEAVDRNAARLWHVIEDVLTLSKIESDAFRTTRQPVNLVEVLAAAVKALRPVAARGITMRPDSPGGPVIVAGDPGQLGRLVLNLISNAVESTPDGGRITAGAEANGALATLTVRGTGGGNPASQQPVLGTRFFGASRAASRPARDMGVELVIARTIAANHGGDLAVRSMAGGGTTVTVSLPLLAAQEGGEPAKEGVEQPPGDRQPATGAEARSRGRVRG